MEIGRNPLIWVVDRTAGGRTLVGFVGGAVRRLTEIVRFSNFGEITVLPLWDLVGGEAFSWSGLI